MTQRRREAHHAALLSLAPDCGRNGIALWRLLARLERKVAAACLSYSNDSGYGTERWERVNDEARTELSRIFGGSIPKGVYINGDPRGHALKLDSDEVKVPEGMERDWGGNGILAATID